MPLPKSFTDLVNNLTILPGVGEKTAERFVYSLYEKDEDEIENLAQSLIDFKRTIRNCSICGCLSDEDECEICQDKTRDKTTICIVEDSKNVFFIEKTRKYNGYYHVLNGLISPIDGIGAEDIRIKELLNRLTDDKVQEVILALSPSVEGEATSLYLTKLIKPFGIKISRIAFGLPVGADLEYADEVTLAKAIEGRRKY
jgi:recombination protein RecR